MATIFYAEDEHYETFIPEMTEYCGHHVTHFIDGQPLWDELERRQAAKEPLPDVVITDGNMKRMHGDMLLKQIAASGMNVGTVILSTDPGSVAADSDASARKHDHRSKRREAIETALAARDRRRDTAAVQSPPVLPQQSGGDEGYTPPNRPSYRSR